MSPVTNAGKKKKSEILIEVNEIIIRPNHLKLPASFYVFPYEEASCTNN